MTNETLTLTEQMKNVLTNIRSLRVFVRELELNEMLEIQSKLNSVIDENLEAAKEKEQEQLEKEKKIADYLEMMQADGIAISDFVGIQSETKQKAKREPKPPKYKFDADGEVKTWTGQGRTPKALQALLDNGHTLNEFLI